MKRITELTHELNIELGKILAAPFSFDEWQGSWRGDRKIRGPHVALTVYGEARFIAKEKRQIVTLFNRYYGPIKPRRRIPVARVHYNDDRHGVRIIMDLLPAKKKAK